MRLQFQEILFFAHFSIFLLFLGEGASQNNKTIGMLLGILRISLPPNFGLDFISNRIA